MPSVACEGFRKLNMRTLFQNSRPQDFLSKWHESLSAGQSYEGNWQIPVS